jgi:hypothetical protein
MDKIKYRTVCKDPLKSSHFSSEFTHALAKVHNFSTFKLKEVYHISDRTCEASKLYFFIKFY